MNFHETIILPSILSANFAHLEKEIRSVESAGAKMLHLDIMDGHFVPNISFGPSIVKIINEITTLPLDVHLMIEEPDRYLEQFKQSGADTLIVHVEVCPHLHRTVSKIKELGMKAGVCLNPATSLSSLDEILPFADQILVMSVNPGFGGQKFIDTSIEKIKDLSTQILQQNLHTIIEVDGGIDKTTIRKVIDAGAQYLVAGNAVFGNGNCEINFSELNSYIP